MFTPEYEQAKLIARYTSFAIEQRRATFVTAGLSAGSEEIDSLVVDIKERLRRSSETKSISFSDLEIISLVLSAQNILLTGFIEGTNQFNAAFQPIVSELLAKRS